MAVLQSCDPSPDAVPIVCKKVVAFEARGMDTVQSICGLDFNEEPMDQSYVDLAPLRPPCLEDVA